MLSHSRMVRWSIKSVKVNVSIHGPKTKVRIHIATEFEKCHKITATLNLTELNLINDYLICVRLLEMIIIHLSGNECFFKYMITNDVWVFY